MIYRLHPDYPELFPDPEGADPEGLVAVGAHVSVRRLLAAYSRIRQNVRNGLAVVTVKRDACGGCFNRIPPQRQVEIRQGKKIIICEYCGRILVTDPEEVQE